MLIEEIVRYATIFSDTTSEDNELVKKLVASGLNLDDAEKYVLFVPVAFGRFVLKNIYNLEFSAT